MKSAIVGSVFIFLSSLALGTTAGVFSYQLGSESLKGVESPNENPTEEIIGSKNIDLSKKQEFKIKAEKEIVTKVNDYVKEQRKINKEKEKDKEKEKKAESN